MGGMRFALALLASLFALGPLSAELAVLPPLSMALLRDAHCRQFMADCLVEGRPARLMVDTGATHTVLAADFVARELPGLRFVEGVRLSGNAAVAPRLAMAELQVGGEKLGQGPVLVMELEGVNSMLGRRVDGILGMSHLARLSFTLDMRPGRQGHWGLPSEVLPLIPLRGSRDGAGRLYLDACCGESRCRLLLDSGSSVTTWPLGQWPAGEKAQYHVQVADVNGARSETQASGAPARLLLAPGAELPQVSPQLRAGGQGHVLGLDALEGGLLLHRAGVGFELLPPADKK